MNRIVGIDILKFIATMMIFNHLAGPYYGKYSFLATGGGIGCALFYFVSGYLCQLGRMVRFDLWMKRRLARLWPTCLVAAFVKGFLGLGCSVAFALAGSGWFVTCLLVYYGVYYFIVRLMSNRLGLLVWISLGMTLIAYAFGWGCQDVDCGAWLFGDNSLKYLLFFVFFIEGAYMAQRKDEVERTISLPLLFGGGGDCAILCNILSGRSSPANCQIADSNGRAAFGWRLGPI